MKTNRTLSVKYKVAFDDDSKLLTEMFADLVRAHGRWLRKAAWEEFSGDGRIVFNSRGVIEWEVEDETTQDA
jgi:hypothetical protein